MTIHILWSLRRLVNAICDRLMNEFDVFLVIEGNRGLGKSTLGFKLNLLVRREMRKRGNAGYQFSPRRDLLYTRREVLKFFHKWKHSGMADEMINVSFNRDFYDEEQKNLIKTVNMNRDHTNFFTACVPKFKTLDSQIKGLTAIKITVLRRGIGIIHMPNTTIYSPDIWDEQINQKIEREWVKGGVSNPKYARLTTFRGYINFPKLTPKQQRIYQEIKDEKRNVIASDNGMDDVDEKDPFEIIYNALLEGKVKNTAMLEGMIIAYDLSAENIKSKIRRQLKLDNKPTKITMYYFDEKEKDDLNKERKKGELSALINSVKEKRVGEDD